MLLFPNKIYSVQTFSSRCHKKSVISLQRIILDSLKKVLYRSRCLKGWKMCFSKINKIIMPPQLLEAEYCISARDTLLHSYGFFKAHKTPLLFWNLWFRAIHHNPQRSFYAICNPAKKNVMVIKVGTTTIRSLSSVWVTHIWLQFYKVEGMGQHNTEIMFAWPEFTTSGQHNPEMKVSSFVSPELTIYIISMKCHLNLCYRFSASPRARLRASRAWC